MSDQSKEKDSDRGIYYVLETSLKEVKRPWTGYDRILKTL
jgi:hypothetical protein